MRISLATGATRVCAAAALAFSLGLAPSFARMGGGPVGAHFAGPAFRIGHSQRFAPRGFNPRFDLGRSGFNRFAAKRFDRFGFNRFGANRFGRFGFDRFDRFNRFGGNQLFVGGWGWGGWGGYSAPTASQPIIVSESTPVIINIGADPASRRRRWRLERGLRHPQAQLRQQRQICRRASDPALLIVWVVE